MPADLTIITVKLPSPLVAPCPQTVDVLITNQGSDPASPVPYDVTIDLGTGDSPGAVFETRVTPPEDQALAPGRSITVQVGVQFPCTAPVNLRATVDSRQQIPNNLRTAPFHIIQNLAPIPVPWLMTQMYVGVRDRSGIVVFNPAGLCWSEDVAVHLDIFNGGCRPSSPSVTEVWLEDVGAMPVPVRLASQSYPVPALAVRSSHFAQVSFPTSGAGSAPAALRVRAWADAKFDNPDQCDRTSLVGESTKPVATGGSPRLAINVSNGGVIRPGELPNVDVEVHNDCSDLGVADIRVLFGTPPTALVSWTLPIPMQDTFRRSNVLNSAQVPSTFWAIGQKSMSLEVLGNGTQGGPYSVSAPINVVPEPIDDTWWNWAINSAGAWKTAYPIAGSFVNRGAAMMTVTALTALEHPTDVTGTASDATINPVGPIPSAPVAPGTSLPAVWFRNQGWTWLAQGTFVEVGPQSRTFSYVASFSVTDVFGNLYPAVASLPTSIPVSVSGFKIGMHALGTSAVTVGLGFLAAAAFVALTSSNPYGWIAAVGLAAVGMAFIIAGTLLLYLAYDPPIPDFTEPELKKSTPRAWRVPQVEGDSLRALSTLAFLVTRAEFNRQRAVQFRDRAWAAWLDRDEHAWLRNRDGALDDLESLRRLADAVANSADEARQEFDEIMQQGEPIPSLDAIREVTGRFFDELGLIDTERAMVEDMLATLDQRGVEEAIASTRAHGLTSLSHVIRTIQEQMTSEFADLEYFRAESTRS